MIDKLIFYPQKNNSYFCKKWKNSEIILNINQQQLQGWFVKVSDPDKSPIVIYYGGNAEDISVNLSYLDNPRDSSLLLMNYRGFGNSTGLPTQKELFSDALAIYDYVISKININPNKIYLMGRSIGSSIAAYVASQRHTGGLILVTPFDSITSFVPKFLRFFPINGYLQRYFNTSKYLEHVEGKFLVIAAGVDEVIPRRCLENLLTKFQDQILFSEIKEADHQNIAEFNQYSDAIENYIHSNLHKCS